jgi:hypothetical protein
MDIAKTCSFVINVACDMCEQWKADPQNFTWTPRDSCPVTIPWFNVGDFTFSTPIWSTFTHKSTSVTEPFAILAQRSADPTTFYLAFRGSQTRADVGVDCHFLLTRYHPPTSSPIEDIKVERGFYSVFNGLDQSALDTALGQVANAGGKLIVAGHSLGSTLATLTVPLARAKNIPSADILHYNQASPKVGDSKFASYYEALDVPTFRLVNLNDEVPKLPPFPYEPVGAEASYGADYPTEAERHNPCSSYSYALYHPSAPYNPANSIRVDRAKPELIS